MRGRGAGGLSTSIIDIAMVHGDKSGRDEEKVLLWRNRSKML